MLYAMYHLMSSISFLQEYARNLQAIGIDAREIDSYRALWQCVAPKDKQVNIQF
jgi:conserved oligomeric Golgi complex subunit 2